MARVTVEDCLKHVDNRFQLVLIATRRARQLIMGAEAKVEENRDKPTVVALREIAEGLIGPEILEEPTIPNPQWIDEGTLFGPPVPPHLLAEQAGTHQQDAGEMEGDGAQSPRVGVANEESTPEHPEIATR